MKMTLAVVAIVGAILAAPFFHEWATTPDPTQALIDCYGRGDPEACRVVNR